MIKKKMIFFVVVGLISISCFSGCVDFKINDLGLIDTISVNPNEKNNQIALCIDNNIYLTNFDCTDFSKIIKDCDCASSLSWVNENLLYSQKTQDVWTLNLYRPGKGARVLLQEMYNIKFPVSSAYAELSYMVFPDENVPLGNLNIYGKEAADIYTLLDNVYYDYEWLPEQRKIVLISATSVHEDSFSGSVLIKDIDDLSEEVIYTGSFTMKLDYIDILENKNIIFSSEGEIYIYNMQAKALDKWTGPEGYDYRLPPSVNSSLKGYVLAKVKGNEEEWQGQLYLVKPNKELISIPGWPVWIREPMIVCIDSQSYDIIVSNLTDNSIVDLTKYYSEKVEKKNRN